MMFSGSTSVYWVPTFDFWTLEPRMSQAALHTISQERLVQNLQFFLQDCILRGLRFVNALYNHGAKVYHPLADLYRFLGMANDLPNCIHAPFGSSAPHRRAKTLAAL